jgi:hypothetical protein
MKLTTHTLSKSALAMLLAFAASHGLADTTSDTELLLNWAEKTYPTIFTVKKTTQTSGPWIYRNYSEKGILAGVNKDDLKVYVMGGPWGNSPVVVGSLVDLMKQVNASTGGGNTGGNNGNFKACEQADMPTGMTYTQNGNVITVTTNGQCIPVPTEQDYCDGIEENYTPQITNISIFTKSNHTTNLKGLTYSSAFESLIKPALESAAGGSSCMIHVPEELKNNLFTVNMDVCYDMTSLYKDLPSVPGLLTVDPSVTFAIKGTSTMQQVSDCFTTGADHIYNLVTKEAWFKEGSGYKKL